METYHADLTERGDPDAIVRSARFQAPIGASDAVLAEYASIALGARYAGHRCLRYSDYLDVPVYADGVDGAVIYVMRVMEAEA